MAHKLSGSLQQMSRIGQRCPTEETNIHVRREYVDVAEGRISQACNGATVMENLPDFIAASSHHFEPILGDGSQFTFTLIHPLLDSWISLDGPAIEQWMNERSEEHTSELQSRP